MSEYSGYNWIDRADRLINREMLIYRLEFKISIGFSGSELQSVTKIFNDAVQAVSNFTKAKNVAP